MKRRLFRYVLMLLMLSFCLICLGCDISSCIPRQPYVYYGEYPALYSVIVCSLPGTGTSSTVVGKLNVLETDSYGRTLFRYTEKEGVYYQNGIKAFIICQQYDDNGAYYYRDIDFELFEYTDESIDNKRIEALKKRNNWEEQLNLNDASVQYTPVFSSFRFSDWDNDNGYFYKCAHVLAKELEDKTLKECFPDQFNGKSIKVWCFDIYDDGRAIFIVRTNERSSLFGAGDSEPQIGLVATYSYGTIYRGSPLWIDDPYSEEYIDSLVNFRAEFEAASEKNG